MDSKQLEKLLAAYLDHELTEAERSLIEEQLQNSSSTRLLDELRQVTQELGRLPRVTLPPNFLRDALARLQRQETVAAGFDGVAGDLLGQPPLAVMAYFDGELSQQQRRAVQEQLLTSSKHRKSLLQIAEVSSELANLPRAELPATFEASLMNRLRAESGCQNESASPVSVPATTSDSRKRKPSVEETLSAYLDGELREEHRESVERKLAHSSRLRQMLRELEQVRAATSQLDVVPAPATIVPNVLDGIRILAGKRKARSERRTGTESVANSSWRQVLAPIGLAASVLLVGIALHRSTTDSSPQVDVATLGHGEAQEAMAAGELLAAKVDSLHEALDQWQVDRRARELAAASGAGVPAANPAPPDVTSEAIAKSAGKAPEETLDNDMESEEPITVVETHRSDDLQLPIDVLANVQPGELISLDSQQVRLVCVDVRKVADRLHIILADHQIPVFTNEESVGDGAAQPKLYMIDVATTPDNLRRVLADLGKVERHQPLIAGVDVREAPEARPAYVAKITAPNNLIKPETNGARRALEQEIEKLAGKSRAIPKEPQDAIAKKAAPPPGAAVAEKKPDLPASTARAPSQRVRLFFVLEPRSRG